MIRCGWIICIVLRYQVSLSCLIWFAFHIIQFDFLIFDKKLNLFFSRNNNIMIRLNLYKIMEDSSELYEFMVVVPMVRNYNARVILEKKAHYDWIILTGILLYRLFLTCLLFLRYWLALTISYLQTIIFSLYIMSLSIYKVFEILYSHRELVEL